MSWVARSVALLALAAAVGIGASGAAGSNRYVYNDSVGDNGGAGTNIFASDIRQVVITNDNRGLVRFEITLVDPEARLIQGDEVDVVIDYDRNQKTGDHGFDYQLSAIGHSTGGTGFVFCRAAALACEAAPYDVGWPRNKNWNVHDTKTAEGVHVVSFDLPTGRPSFDFLVQTSYPNTQGYTNRYDYAPDPPGKLLTYEILGADADHDGVWGYADKCRSTRAPARFDPNRNGCPGPFGRLHADRPETTLATRSSGFLHLTNLRIGTSAAGSRVVVGSSAGTFSAFANGAGIARVWRGTRSVRIGSSVRVRVTKPGFIGLFRRYRVTSTGFKLQRELCLRPIGGAIAPCAGLKGR